MAHFPIPEILRVPLESISLTVKVMREDDDVKVIHGSELTDFQAELYIRLALSRPCNQSAKYNGHGQSLEDVTRSRSYRSGGSANRTGPSYGE